MDFGYPNFINRKMWLKMLDFCLPINKEVKVANFYVKNLLRKKTKLKMMNFYGEIL